ncbi:MAG: UvrD-helicase domain-containing protein [Lachnospiraceae bacterium]|nr:UvrD-helicase domain-containing protein [Lachnospiraceae bacterium]
MTELEMQQEQQRYLDLVEEKLEKRICGINSELEEGAKEVEEMHDYYWENYTEMDEYGYENFDNQQALLQQVSSNNAKLDLKRRLRKMQDSPYFGRVDFQYDGDSFSEAHYIGIGNFAERDGAMPLIFDWRAPVSGLFYDFEKGPASYEAPRGAIEGEVTAKWQYKIRHGKMVYAVESDLKIDDDILKQELSSNGDVHLKNIVRTIQKEQNQIIRNTKDKILVVQGAAGSGKTSIALHRIAYLLYHDRKYLKASEILILSPNRVFSNYISHILPELGEENIREMSFDYFSWKELKGIAADCEDCYDQMERILKQADEKAARRNADQINPQGQGTVDKQSKAFAQEIHAFLLMQEDELVTIRDISYKKLQKTASELNQLFYYKFPDIPLLRRMDAVMDYVVDETETLLDRDFSEDEKIAVKEKFDRMYETKDIYCIYNKFLEEQGLPKLPDAEVKDRVIPYEDVYPLLYMKYLLEGTGGRKRVRHLVIDEMQDYSYIQYQILAKLFPCKMTIVGDRCQTMKDSRQDVMKFLPSILGKEIRMLSIQKSYRNTTEIAEYAQNIIGEHSIENLGRHGKEPEVIFAAGLDEAAVRIAADLKLAGDGGRTEKQPEPELDGRAEKQLQPGSDERVEKQLQPEPDGRAEKQSQPGPDGRTEKQSQPGPDGKIENPEKNGSGQEERQYETAAVICMTMAEAKAVYEKLKAVLEEKGMDWKRCLSLIDKNSEEFKPGLAVTTFYLAKGLEFDQVFHVYRQEQDEPIHRQAKYIAATRALHELYVLEIGE